MKRRTLAELERRDDFLSRHLGPGTADRDRMLAALGFASTAEMMSAALPPRLHRGHEMDLPGPCSERDALAALASIAAKNRTARALIGQGYYGTEMPAVVKRNVLENPAWYTAYTPYQPEISQGRLRALLNFQQTIIDMTGMEIANASLLDEATAAAEGLALAARARGGELAYFCADDVLPQTLEVVATRAAAMGVPLTIGPAPDAAASGAGCVLLQYPGADGAVVDYRAIVEAVHAAGGLVVVAADLLALARLAPPGEWGADVVVGSTQRFGLPPGAGGPHAGYLATRDKYKRNMPGRLVGLTIDAQGNPALRLALQTREQHIRREKATSNICTAQVLPAILASFYAVHHGPDGIATIAARVHRLTATFVAGLARLGVAPESRTYFDTLTFATGAATADFHARAEAAGFLLRRIDGNRLGLSFDELSTRAEVEALWEVFVPGRGAALEFDVFEAAAGIGFPPALLRESAFLRDEVFHRYRAEHELLRYLRRLADQDLALDRTMIPLGSCTMKLNATSEMLPITWRGFADVHPFAPASHQVGYQQLYRELGRHLCEITGYAAVSFQPNAGSQGELAGLLAIKAYHASRAEAHRDVCLIPVSAHGTNPASAHLAGMRVVEVACDAHGSVDPADLAHKAAEHAPQLAACMMTYPSTHGVFEAEVQTLCAIVHEHGGQVYIDGANMNALVGWAAPGEIGGDVSHLNLHKTFCIPHGGGGPGIGAIGVAAHLVPFLPNHRASGHEWSPDGIGAVAGAPYGSAMLLPISWMYVTMMGREGLCLATEYAVLAANYLAQQLRPHYPVLYTGPSGLVAHECILDLRAIKERTGITNEDVAKRLIDYGFHAPTVSFPVPGTLMVEPTESESLAELERFVAAMLAIREEIRAVEEGRLDRLDNPLKNAPHTAAALLAAEWPHGYTREQAAYPVAALRGAKYWPPVGRADGVHGDRHLVTSLDAAAALTCPAR
ncbi:MAG: aminomethyl-transferring glycine dehydrogenase [Gammaproteobacteria bacterium]|nr:aminomethyl-transferring glycine dehydrogenase [Gammaproteobacteria bacterium]